MFDLDSSSFFLDHKNICKNNSLFTKIIAAKDLVCKEDDLYCNYYYLATVCPKKRGILVDMAMTPLKSIRKGKVGWCWWKIQHKCCRIGTKLSKIGGEMAKKN